MFTGISKTILILLVALPAAPLVQARVPAIVSKIATFPNYLFFHSFIKSDLPEGYEDLTAKEKQDILWDLCSKDETPATLGNPLKTLTGLFPRNMHEMFDHISDERPWRGTKPIHISGPVCKARFDASPASPYTGLFKGCKTLLVRLSPGGEVGNPDVPPPVATLTGIGAKFLVDGLPSRNICAFRRKGNVVRDPDDPNWLRWFVDGDQSTTPSNPFDFYPLELKFGTSSKQPVHLGLSELAEIDTKGNEVANPKFPFEIVMAPNKALRHITFEKLTKIPSGTKLYDVYAREKDQDSPKKLIGSIRSTSRLTRSNWGDLKLFFRHIRRDVDLKKMGLECPYLPAEEQYEKK